MIRSLQLSVAFFLLACISASLFADERHGIVKTKPTSGRFVETHRGYMVPYKTKIPGTNVEFEMVPIPGGTFLMGSPRNETGRKGNEGPQIKVKVRPFWMGKYEITWNEYREYLALDGIFKTFDRNKIRLVTDKNKIDAISAPSGLYEPELVFEKGDEPDQPAVMMTQYAARQYTKWLSLTSGQFYRLPTGAEWEYACRAGTKTAYYFGDDASKLGEYAWYNGNAKDLRNKVGQKKPNPWGLYDMHGNVAEWVIDFEAGDGYSRWKDKSVIADRDIRWPKSLDDQVVRGGSFEMQAKQCRSASMLLSKEDDWKDYDPDVPQSPWWFTTEPATGVGFRIIRPLGIPMTRELREKFHGPDVEETRKNVKMKINSSGRGSYGLVGKDLPKAIKQLFGEK